MVGVPHPKWDERPLLLVQLKPGEDGRGGGPSSAFLEGKIAKWWTPDEVLVLDEVPLGATGKLDKKTLRARYADRFMGGEAKAAAG